MLVSKFYYEKSSETPFTLYRCTFCSGTEGVSVQRRLHCSGAEVVPGSITVCILPVQEVYCYGARVVALF